MIYCTLSLRVYNASRELNQSLKAWDAIRLAKDAQVAALMEKTRRHEEESGDRLRAIDSLRKKLGNS